MKKQNNEKKKGMFIHILAYILVCIITFTIDVLTSPGIYWFYWPVMGMGISVIIHWFVDFGYEKMFSNQEADKL